MIFSIALVGVTTQGCVTNNKMKILKNDRSRVRQVGILYGMSHVPSIEPQVIIYETSTSVETNFKIIKPRPPKAGLSNCEFWLRVGFVTTI